MKAKTTNTKPQKSNSYANRSKNQQSPRQKIHQRSNLKAKGKMVFTSKIPLGQRPIFFFFFISWPDLSISVNLYLSLSLLFSHIAPLTLGRSFHLSAVAWRNRGEGKERERREKKRQEGRGSCVWGQVRERRKKKRKREETRSKGKNGKKKKKIKDKVTRGKLWVDGKRWWNLPRPIRLWHVANGDYFYF